MKIRQKLIFLPIIGSLLMPAIPLYSQCNLECDDLNNKNNTYLGFEAGNANKNSTGSQNTFVGEAAGKLNTIGTYNSFMGVSAGLSNSSGSFNSFYGRDAGRRNTTGGWNSAFGVQAGFSNTLGTNNAYFGVLAGFENTIGKHNSMIGFQSGFNNSVGSYNVFVGAKSGLHSEGTGNLILGVGAGPTSINANDNFKLYIDVDTNATPGNDQPLIYGEFDNDFVRINGTFEVTAGLTNPSSVKLKKDFRFIDSNTILERISSLEIKEWSYRQDPLVRHIGPTAEDFHDTFGVGMDSTTISTIDADGVSLLAIQALKIRVDYLDANNAVLLERISKLEVDAQQLRSENLRLLNKQSELSELTKSILIKLDQIETK